MNISNVTSYINTINMMAHSPSLNNFTYYVDPSYDSYSGDDLDQSDSPYNFYFDRTNSTRDSSFDQMTPTDLKVVDNVQDGFAVFNPNTNDTYNIEYVIFVFRHNDTNRMMIVNRSKTDRMNYSREKCLFCSTVLMLIVFGVLYTAHLLFVYFGF